MAGFLIFIIDGFGILVLVLIVIAFGFPTWCYYLQSFSEEYIPYLSLGLLFGNGQDSVWCIKKGEVTCLLDQM